MINPIWTEEAIEAIQTKKLSMKSFYLDESLLANAVLEKVVENIEQRLYECPNVEKYVCTVWWKHDECTAFMRLLEDLTGNDRYREKKWVVND
jgi:hypothetical protein